MLVCLAFTGGNGSVYPIMMLLIHKLELGLHVEVGLYLLYVDPGMLAVEH